MTSYEESIRLAMLAAYNLGMAHGWATARGEESLVEGWQDRDDQLNHMITDWVRAQRDLTRVDI